MHNEHDDCLLCTSGPARWFLPPTCEIMFDVLHSKKQGCMPTCHVSKAHATCEVTILGTTCEATTFGSSMSYLEKGTYVE